MGKMKTESGSVSGLSSNSQLRLTVLAILVVQNCSLILLMRYSRLTQSQSSTSPNAGGSNSGSSGSGNSYIISTAVIISELIKFLISFIVIYYQKKSQITISSSSSSSSSSSCITHQTLILQRICYEDFYLNSIELLKLSIPSFLYVIQNNLQYLAVTYLSVSIFQILSQLKIVTTAIFSVAMLRNKKLSPQQWMSIVALTCGVGLVQYTQQQQQQQVVTTDLGMKDDHTNSYLLGVVCVLFSCVTSGFSGVYFERVLKSGGLTLWMRNTHLSFIGLILSAILCLYNDYEAITTKGFFFGYNTIVWIVILLQAGGGLVRILSSLPSPSPLTSSPYRRVDRCQRGDVCR
jgi:solute carrier family 35 (UDP-sugar transporter), member A1/2/3